MVRFWAMAVVALAANCAWAGVASPITPLGNNTYNLTVHAKHMFTRNTGKLKEEAMDVATKFCAKEGKQLKVVSVTEDKSLLLYGRYTEFTMTFKALDPHDPEPVAPAQVQATPPQAMPPAAITPTAASPETEMLYADMLRLEDLRKRGLLNDAEFEREKQKVLARSK